MPTDFRHTNSLDEFSRRVGETLQKHTQPVDTSVWSKIEEKLATEKKSVLPVWLVVAGVAAVFAGVLFFTLPFSTRVSEEVQIVQQKAEIAADESEKADIKIESLSEPQKNIAEKSDGKSEKVLVASHRVGAEQEKESQLKAEEPISTEIVEKPQYETDDFAEVPSEEIVPTTEPTESAAEQITEKSPESASNDIVKKHHLIARLGGGGISGGLPSDNRPPMYGDITNGTFPPGTNLGGDGKFEGGLAPSDYSEVHHLPPVSASLMVEFPINQTWSLESGLKYTYLVSKYGKKDGIEYSGRLTQHYLGIPVNLKANLLEKNNWRIYILGGGAVEKGITSLYKQEIRYSNGQVHHFNTRAGIKGFQFSGQMATGFDYEINKNIRIFGEPYMIYYFKNNQPMSAHTEGPLTLGINAGVRVQFK